MTDTARNAAPGAGAGEPGAGPPDPAPATADTQSADTRPADTRPADDENSEDAETTAGAADAENTADTSTGGPTRTPPAAGAPPAAEASPAAEVTPVAEASPAVAPPPHPPAAVEPPAPGPAPHAETGPPDPGPPRKAAPTPAMGPAPAPEPTTEPAPAPAAGPARAAGPAPAAAKRVPPGERAPAPPPPPADPAPPPPPPPAAPAPTAGPTPPAPAPTTPPPAAEPTPATPPLPPEPAPADRPSAPPPPDPVEQAFDHFYVRTVRPLTRQVALLTGDPELTRRAVEHAYCTAWQRWTEVALDPCPEGWLRPVAYDYALAPWRQLGLATPSCPVQRALRALPPHHRRAVMLYNGLGLDLPDTAAELEATTAAAGGRLVRAHAALAGSVSGLGGADPRTRAFSRRLGALLEKAGAAVEVPTPVPPSAIRERVHEQARRGMLATAALVAAFLLSTAAVSILTADGPTAPPTSPTAETPHPRTPG